MNQISWLRSRRVAVLKGGWSRERPISLKTGAAVEVAFHRLKIPFFSIDVNRSIFSVLAKKKIQFAFIALHGEFGEDGGIQSGLEAMKIPYTGSGPVASGIAMDKDLSKKIFRQAGVPTPEWTIVPQNLIDHDETMARAIALLKRGPVFVKPIDQGSAIGAAPAKNHTQLKKTIRDCLKYSSTALVERYIKGREITVGILGETALPVVEIVPEHRFYDFHSKYAKGGSRHLVPAPIAPPLMEKAKAIALRAFRSLKCSVYGRVDILLPPRGAMQVLEVNTIPGMTSTSLLPDAARAAGIPFDDLVLRIAILSLKARGVSLGSAR